MGMFDYVIVEYELPDAVAAKVREWQTKTFDAPFMLKYRITKDGRLEQERIHYEDRSDKNAAPGTLESVMGMMTPIHEGWDDMNYHGILNFYGGTGDSWTGEWVEYDAKFTAGRLVSIERVPPPTTETGA